MRTGSRQQASTEPPRRVIALHWTDVDRHRTLLGITIVGAALALALAVFGLPPVSLHGPLHRFGIMDPLCGMTRATRFLARGNFAQAWDYNPASFALFAFAAAVVTRGAIGRATGRWLDLVLVRRNVLIAAITIAIGLLWLNQQVNAARLR